MLKKITPFALLFLSSLMLNLSFSSKAFSQSPQAGQVSKFGLKVPPMETVPEIKEYIRSVLYQSLPKDYIYPLYIAKTGSPEAALAEMGRRFPQFHGKEGPDYLEAVKNYPLLFQDMIMENRAIREAYSPKTSSTAPAQH